MAANREKIPLTVENFVAVIKGLDERDRSKYRAAELIEVIIQLPDHISYEQTEANVYNHVNYLLDEVAPYRKLTKKEIKLKSKPWINREIQFFMNKRDRLLHKYCTERDPLIKESLYNKFKIERNKLTKMKRESKILYYRNYFDMHKNKSAMIWKGIRSLVNLKPSSNKDIYLLDVNGCKLTVPKDIAGSFNNYFANVGKNIDKKIRKSKRHFSDYLHNIKSDRSFFLRACKSEEIFDLIVSFDLKKSTGPNSIPIFILKTFNHFFSDNLSKIMNLSFVTGIFPDICKVAKVIPLYKKDDPLFCKNYKPISLLPIFSKIFEKIIYKRMYSFLNDNKLIYNRQFGFRSNYSTDHALISSIETIKKKLDSGNYVCGVFIDLEKAFDTVNYEILCNKLTYYGFRGKIELLIKSFLSNRKQLVSINSFESSELPLNCGVPQGSTLGPLLFLIYINDFRFCLKNSHSSHFADDTCIISSAKQLKSIESELNYDLKSATTWLEANRLSLNVDKSKLIIFHSKQKIIDYDNFTIKLAGTKLKPTGHVKYLGIFIDNNLSWDYHVHQLSKKLSRANGIISKLRHFTPKSTLVCLLFYFLFPSYIWFTSVVINI